MVKGEYKKVLWEVFDVLGFFEDEKERALEGFKKKFAAEMLGKIQNALSEDQRRWIEEVMVKKQYDRNDPKVSDIQKTIESALSKEEFDNVSRSVFKKILLSYTDFMASKIDAAKSEKLNKIAAGF